MNLLQFKKLCDEALDGPWTAYLDGDSNSYVTAEPRPCSVVGVAHDMDERDAVFVAACREMVPQLLDENDRLRQELRTVEDQRNDLAAVLTGIAKQSEDADDRPFYKRWFEAWLNGLVPDLSGVEEDK